MNKLSEEISRWSKPPELLVFDFDGVMTDNSVLLSQDGQEFVVCSRSDGMGISFLKKNGYRLLVLSTESNLVVSARCQKLGINCIQNVSDKFAVLSELCQSEGIRFEDVLYVCNDINDLECLQSVGYPIVVSDSHKSVMKRQFTVTLNNGGRGAVREVADEILRKFGPKT